MTNCENNTLSSGDSFCRDGFTELLHLEISVGIGVVGVAACNQQQGEKK